MGVGVHGLNLQVNLMTCADCSKPLVRLIITLVTLKRILMSFWATSWIVADTAWKYDCFTSENKLVWFLPHVFGAFVCLSQVLCLLLAFKIQYPKRVFLVRGNHEDSAMNKNYGFGAECMSRFGSEAVGGKF